VSFTVAEDGQYVITAVVGTGTYKRRVTLVGTPEQDLSSLGEIREAIRELGTTAGTPAGLNVVGTPKAVFIENEGTLPPDLDPYTLVIEQA
jgi:hypothetical protein